MSCKESIESTLLANNDGNGSLTCDSANPSSTSVTVIAEELSQSSCTNNDTVQMTEGSVNTSSVVNGKKPLICYEKMNGFTHMKNHDVAPETVVNGEALLTSSCGQDDAKSNPKAFISFESKMNSEDVCSIPAKSENISTIHLAGQNISESECVETVENHSEGHSVEELIDKLASTPISSKEDSEQLSLIKSDDTVDGINYVIYESERQMPDIMRLITKDLSEPYSIYTYRYFIHNWPKLCFLAMDKENCVGAIVCKLDVHKKMVRRGYIAMLAVDSEYRRRRIGSTLVTKAIHAMIRDDCDEVVLETEITNQAALHLYENLGFVRDKRLFRYYLNGVDALRLKLWLR